MVVAQPASSKTAAQGSNRFREKGWGNTIFSVFVLNWMF
jgi:hypothetical protein